MKLDPICITKQKFRFENEGERDLEKKGTDDVTPRLLSVIWRKLKGQIGN